MLAWQGPISDARRPLPKNEVPVNYILVGAKSGKLWVNERSLPAPTPTVLKAALLEAAKNPATQKPKK